MNIGGDLRLILYFINTATHCQRRKISFYTVWALRRYDGSTPKADRITDQVER
jgi:hypothetical protein